MYNTGMTVTKTIKEKDIGLDIGHGSIKLFKTYLEESNTIIWNGPVGKFEIEEGVYEKEMLQKEKELKEKLSTIL